LWETVCKYRQWRCLLGCSIQQPAGVEKERHEAEAGQGLHLMHAYSMVDVGEIESVWPSDQTTWKVRLVRLRNPWGHGKWEGPWGDSCPWRTIFDRHIRLAKHPMGC
ncbi:unnamed protein product, partial [Discosporangium mesarthrocarpum]